MCAHMCGEFSLALEALDSSLQKDAWLAIGYYRRAQLLTQMRLFDEALADFKSCVLVGLVGRDTDGLTASLLTLRHLP